MGLCYRSPSGPTQVTGQGPAGDFQGGAEGDEGGGSAVTLLAPPGRVAETVPAPSCAGSCAGLRNTKPLPRAASEGSRAAVGIGAHGDTRGACGALRVVPGAPHAPRG